MDKQAFKQRMQNLKSYRENNPGKGYWDWRNSLPDNLKYTDDTEYDMVGAYNSGAQPTLEDDGSYHLPTRVPSTGKVLKSSIHPTYWKGLAEDERLGYHTYWLPDGSTYTASKYDVPIQAYQNGGRHALGVGQVFASLANMLFNKERRTPAIAAAAYHTIHQTQNDLALAPVEAPLIEPIVDAIKSVDETPYDPGEVFLLSPENQKKQMTKNPNYRVVDTNSEEDPYGIVRRAADIDQKYGTEYNKVYDKLTKEYEDITSYVNMVEPEFVKDPDAFARIKPAKSGKKISLSEDNITKPEDFPTGLIRHEIGHYVDEMAYPGGVPNNAYLRQLGKPSKYRPFEEVKDIFRSPDKALQDYRYLRNPTEKKSIMNQFDEYLMNNYTPSTYPQTTKEFKEAIEKAPDIHRNMKLLLKIHNKPSILFKDFKNRPLVNNTTKDKNKELV